MIEENDTSTPHVDKLKSYIGFLSKLATTIQEQVDFLQNELKQFDSQVKEQAN